MSENFSEERVSYRDKNLLIIFAVTLTAIMGVSSITPAFPKIVHELQISPKEIGLLITVFTLPGVVLTLILGILADHWGRKKILVPSLLLFGFAGGACTLARDFELLLVFRFFQGIGAASLGSLNITILGDLYAGKKRTAAMGYNASVLSIGTASYPVIGGTLAILGWYYPFVLSLLAVPVGLLVLFFLKNPEPKNNQQFLKYLRHVWQTIKNRQVVCLFFANVVTFIILYGSYLTYYPFLIKNKFGGSEFVIGIIMSIMSLATAITSSQLGRFANIFSEKTLLKTGFLIYAFSMFMVSFMPNIWMLLIPTLIYGMGHGILIPTVQTMLTTFAPMEQRAGVMSLNGMVLRLGQTLGPILIGFAFTLWSLDGVFYTGAGFAVFIFVLCIVMI